MMTRRYHSHALAAFAETGLRSDLAWSRARRAGCSRDESDELELDLLSRTPARAPASSSYRDLAQAAFAYGDPAAAERWLERSIEHEGDPRAHCELVHLRLYLDDEAGAIDAARWAQHRGVDLPEIYWGWAIAAARLGDADTAEQALHQASKRVKKPYRPAALLWGASSDAVSAPTALYHGIVSWYLGQSSEAKQAFHEAVFALTLWNDPRADEARGWLRRFSDDSLLGTLLG
jgi:tetratricopeptide (TPR) repeat protein